MEDKEIVALLTKLCQRKPEGTKLTVENCTAVLARKSGLRPAATFFQSKKALIETTIATLAPPSPAKGRSVAASSKVDNESDDDYFVIPPRRKDSAVNSSSLVGQSRGVTRTRGSSGDAKGGARNTKEKKNGLFDDEEEEEDDEEQDVIAVPAMSLPPATARRRGDSSVPPSQRHLISVKIFVCPYCMNTAAVENEWNLAGTKSFANEAPLLVDPMKVFRTLVEADAVSDSQQIFFRDLHSLRDHIRDSHNAEPDKDTYLLRDEIDDEVTVKGYIDEWLNTKNSAQRGKNRDDKSFQTRLGYWYHGDHKRAYEQLVLYLIEHTATPEKRKRQRRAASVDDDEGGSSLDGFVVADEEEDEEEEDRTSSSSSSSSSSSFSSGVDSQRPIRSKTGGRIVHAVAATHRNPGEQRFLDENSQDEDEEEEDYGDVDEVDRKRRRREERSDEAYVQEYVSGMASFAGAARRGVAAHDDASEGDDCEGNGGFQQKNTRRNNRRKDGASSSSRKEDEEEEEDDNILVPANKDLEASQSDVSQGDEELEEDACGDDADDDAGSSERQRTPRRNAVRVKS